MNCSSPVIVVRQADGGVIARTESTVVVAEKQTTAVVLAPGKQGPSGPPGPAGADGAQGEPGLRVTGAVQTAADLPATGAPGDLVVTRDDSHGHAWTEAGWVDVGPIALQGPAGAPGKNGNIHFKGHGAPGTILGAQPGDSYLDELNGTIYTLL